jgi:PAS domain S-box-containing protein
MPKDKSVSVQTLLDVSIDAAFLFSTEGELVELNKEALRRLKRLKPELKNKSASFFIGRKMSEFFPEEFIATCNKYRKSVVKEKKPMRFQYQLGKRILDIIAYPVQNKDNPCCDFAVYSREITNELEVESKIKHSEEKYWNLIDQMYEGYILADKNGVITFINEAVVKIGGFRKSDLVGKNIMDLFPKKESKKIEYNFKKLKQLEKIRLQTTYYTKKKELLTLLFSVSPIIDRYGEFDGVQSTITDITVLKLIKEKLEYRIEFEKRIIDISSSFINLQESEIDKGIQDALDIIGNFNNENSLILYILNENKDLYYKSHEWYIKNSNESFDYPEELSISTYPYFSSILKMHEVIQVPDISALPPEIKKETAIPGSFGIKSFLIVPMILKNRLVGFLGTGSMKLKTWSEDEISMMKMAMSVIAIIIERKKINSDLIDVIFQRLSDREKEFVEFLGKGYKWPKDKRLIGKKMDVLPGTLDKFMQRIKEKVGSNELEMIIKSLQN